MPPGIATNGVILRGLGRTMRKFKRRQRHSLPFGLFLAVVAALLLPAALAPRADAEVDANFSWTGFTAAGWNNPGNWSPLGSARPRRYRPLQRPIPQSAQSHHWCYCRHSAHDDRCHSKRHALCPPAGPSTSVASACSVPAFWSITPMLPR